MVSRRMQSAGAWLFVLASIVTWAAQPAVAADKNVGGYWKSFDKDTGKVQSVFRVWEDKGKLVGKILKTFPKPGEKPQERCTECEGAQKDQPIIGIIFMWGLEREADNPRKWTGGKVLNPSDGKVYNVEVELSEDGETLNVYGYIRILVKVGGTNVWKRASLDEAK
jgi:uncharacterized protein (DUF2147 family)